MKNKNKIILFIAFLVISIILFANMESDRVSIGKAISMEVFVTINMLVFILYPLSVSLSPVNYKKTFWKLFAIRAGILLFLDLYIPLYTAIADFFLVYFGIITFGPISSIISKTKSTGTNQQSTAEVAQNTPQQQHRVNCAELRCAKCNTPLKITYKFCPNCGEGFVANNVEVSKKQK